MAVPTRITRFTDANYEPVAQDRAPLKGFEDAPIVPLEDTLKRVSTFFNRIEEEAWVAKENCQQPKEGLTQDESASIHLYTMQFKGGPSLFEVLNQNLRAENRDDLKPWFMFLKLFLTALHKLPSHAGKVWRGVRGIDLSDQYPKKKKFFWWGITSCTTELEVLESDNFLGKTGKRTLFSIDCQNGKSIALHSYFKNKEEEIILIPGSYFEVISLVSPAKGLHIIDIKEIEPPFPTVARLIEKVDDFRSTSKTTSAKNSSFSQASLHSSSNGK
jgi:hypothetical protein